MPKIAGELKIQWFNSITLDTFTHIIYPYNAPLSNNKSNNNKNWPPSDTLVWSHVYPCLSGLLFSSEISNKKKKVNYWYKHGKWSLFISYNRPYYWRTPRLCCFLQSSFLSQSSIKTICHMGRRNVLSWRINRHYLLRPHFRKKTQSQFLGICWSYFCHCSHWVRTWKAW